MSNQLLTQLENKINETIETIEFLRLEIEELEQKVQELEHKNLQLFEENNLLKDKHATWETTLRTMLNKLNHLDNAVQLITTGDEINSE